ncbi:hypothetical protein D5085_00985 [Ectothiorhodospiraceae bacterium BW-2]|nr:hypothetical protein D5085_00985 [Ectothiorhodospiraceae bacterium BW-2]
MPTLKIELLDYSLPGSGKGDSADFDETVRRDSDGLPLIAGKHLKGLIRQALRCGSEWGWLPTIADSYQQPDEQNRPLDWSRLLFGASLLEDGRNQSDTHIDESERGMTADEGYAGRLHISNALLPQAVADHLRNHPEQQSLLFVPIGSNRINEYGATVEHSRRRIEVVIPLTFYATLTPTDELPTNWQAVIQTVLPLISAIGKQRRRGYGRAQLTLLTEGV